MFTQSNICIIITIVLYLAFMLYLGFRYADSSSQSVGDFYLGGRKLGPLVTAMSAEASDMSSWLLMGLPGAWPTPPVSATSPGLPSASASVPI